MSIIKEDRKSTVMCYTKGVPTPEPYYNGTLILNSKPPEL